eukprot:780491_1
MESDPNEIDIDINEDTDLKQTDTNNTEPNDTINTNKDIEMENSDNVITEQSKQKEKKLKIQFRNYIPKCPKLRKKYCVPPAKFIEIEDEFTELIEKAKVLNHDIHDITPKKINWDLKRDCQPQLDQLKYLTQLAIRKIVEEKQANMSEDDTDDDDEDDNDD